MDRFELTDSVGRRVWTVDIIDGTTVRTGQGKVGCEPTEKEKRFPSVEAARQEVERLIAKQRVKGYERIEPFTISVAELPRTIVELVDSIARAPEDIERYSVYADWLQDQGDPLGVTDSGASPTCP